MTTWLTAITDLAPHATPAVLVTVAQVQGSAPREAGAKMVVSADSQFDTIGGGHLELQACEIARSMLADDAPSRRIARFALGPSLGQCCGGAVQLAFERLDVRAWADLQRLAAHRLARRDTWRVVPIETEDDALLLDAAGVAVSGHAAAHPRFDEHLPCHLTKDEQGKTWLIDPCRVARAHLVLFGAGHVGAALVRALADLACHVTWVDEREDMFPPVVPPNVQIECTDVPEAVVEEVAPGASFLVMTHSHALDQRLSEAILLREDMLWFGLIGSDTKRVQFERRLRARGISEERLNDMVCPIGIPGIRGKAPAVIAASVCAQLLQVWEAAQQQHAASGDLAA